MKKGRHHRRTPLRAVPSAPGGAGPRERADARPDPDPELLRDVRRALKSDHPVDLLGFVSTLLGVTDARPPVPLALDRRSAVPSVVELVDSFAAVDRTETAALLAVIAEMHPDELVRARAQRGVGGRGQRLPPWLRELPSAAPYRTVEMTHALGDGDDVVIGVRLHGRHELTVVVYVDHNLGTVVKDAFVVPDPISDLIALMRDKIVDPDVRWDEIEPADARARITDAVERAVRLRLPFESDTWPACRPLVEWIVRKLPEGGVPYTFSEWTVGDVEALAARFLASPFGEPFGEPRDRELLTSLLWFATEHGLHDPLRWSPVSVEVALVDWLPNELRLPVEVMDRVPRLLRALVRFCHDEIGIRAALTHETLASIDRFEPFFRAETRAARFSGGFGDGLQSPFATEDEVLASIREMNLARATRAVGGPDALEHLDVDALPDEPIDWALVPRGIEGAVETVGGLVDRWCDALPDVELRTACRRLLVDVVAADPGVVRRAKRLDVLAAAICWIVGKANDVFSADGVMVKDLCDHFGTSSGAPSQRAATILRAIGVPTEQYGAMVLGSTRYLVSSRRRALVAVRDAAR